MSQSVPAASSSSSPASGPWTKSAAPPATAGSSTRPDVPPVPPLPPRCRFLRLLGAAPFLLQQRHPLPHGPPRGTKNFVTSWYAPCPAPSYSLTSLPCPESH